MSEKKASHCKRCKKRIPKGDVCRCGEAARADSIVAPFGAINLTTEQCNTAANKENEHVRNKEAHKDNPENEAPGGAFSIPPPRCHACPACRNANKGAHKGIWSFLKGIGVLLATAFPIMLAISTFNQYQETFEIGNRAYLNLKESKLYSFGKTNTKSDRTPINYDERAIKVSPWMYMAFIFSNKGQTPALSVRSASVNFLVDDKPSTAELGLTPIDEVPDLLRKDSIVQPDSEYLVSGEIVLTKDQVEATLTGQSFAMFMTYVEYQDVFGATHGSWACAQYHLRSNTLGRCQAGNFSRTIRPSKPRWPSWLWFLNEIRPSGD